jgi:hypothetical protein
MDGGIEEIFSERPVSFFLGNTYSYFWNFSKPVLVESTEGFRKPARDAKLARPTKLSPL